MQIVKKWRNIFGVGRFDSGSIQFEKWLTKETVKWVKLNGYAEANRIMALIGPSGSGKSTLLVALAGSFLFFFFSPNITICFPFSFPDRISHLVKFVNLILCQLLLD